MTADVKLLPLPEPVAVKYSDSGLRDDEHALRLWAAHGYDTGGEPLFSAEQLREATAPLQAEVEALRELCGMAYQLAGVHDAPEKWLDALSNAAAGRPFSTDGLLPYMPQAVCDAEAEAKALLADLDLRDSIIATHAADTREYQKRISRAEAHAERLAEALREARQMIRDLLPDMTFAKWDALLRDQEEGNEQ